MHFRSFTNPLSLSLSLALLISAGALPAAAQVKAGARVLATVPAGAFPVATVPLLLGLLCEVAHRQGCA
jgi:hypothetical protein